jgi:hypothetical protein
MLLTGIARRSEADLQGSPRLATIVNKASISRPLTKTNRDYAAGHPLTQVILKRVFVVVVSSPLWVGAMSFQRGQNLLCDKMTADNFH